MNKLFFGIALVSLLLVSGCVTQVNQAFSTTPKPPVVEGGVVGVLPTVEIVNPKNGSLFTSADIPFQVTATDFSFDSGYLQYYLDGSTDFGISNQQTFMVSGLSNGQHEVLVELIQSNAQPYNPKVTTTVRFSVQKEQSSITILHPLNGSIGYDSNTTLRWIPINFPYPLNGSYSVKLDLLPSKTTRETKMVLENLSPGYHSAVVEWLDAGGKPTGAKQTTEFQVGSVKPTLLIDAPVDGARFYSRQFTASVTVKDFQIVSPRTINQPNQGHLEYALDGNAEASKENPKTLQFNGFGSHELKISLLNNDESPTGVSKTIRLVYEKTQTGG